MNLPALTHAFHLLLAEKPKAMKEILRDIGTQKFAPDKKEFYCNTKETAFVADTLPEVVLYSLEYNYENLWPEYQDIYKTLKYASETP